MLDCGMAFSADLHLHSRYAYACSKDLNLANMAAWAKVKGIGLLSSADFTHPAWLAELEENLTPVEDGAYEFDGARFVLGTELSCIFKQGGAPAGFICWSLPPDSMPSTASVRCSRSCIPS